jgi:hypothetical protein
MNPLEIFPLVELEPNKEKALPLPAQLQEWIIWLEDDVVAPVLLFPPKINYVAVHKAI